MSNNPYDIYIVMKRYVLSYVIEKMTVRGRQFLALGFKQIKSHNHDDILIVWDPNTLNNSNDSSAVWMFAQILMKSPYDQDYYWFDGLNFSSFGGYTKNPWGIPFDRARKPNNIDLAGKDISLSVFI